MIETCKYCKDYSIENLPYRTNVADKRLISLIAAAEDGNKELVIHTLETGSFGLQINYCPMCGRRIRK